MLSGSYVFSSVIGTPREESWPQQTRIDLSLFVVVDPQPWTELLKKECGLSAHDLLSVSTCNYSLSLDYASVRMRKRGIR